MTAHPRYPDSGELIEIGHAVRDTTDDDTTGIVESIEPGNTDDRPEPWVAVRVACRRTGTAWQHDPDNLCRIAPCEVLEDRTLTLPRSVWDAIAGGRIDGLSEVDRAALRHEALEHQP